MPKFTKQKKEVKPARGVIPQEVIDEYKGFIEQTDKDDVGSLEFEEGENIKLGRKALQQAGEESKNYVKVRKPRGQDNVLEFEHITRTEWAAARKAAKERGAKIRKTATESPEAKAKPKAKRKARAKKS